MLGGGSSCCSSCCFNSCSSFKLTPSCAMAELNTSNLMSDLSEVANVSLGDFTAISFTPSYQSWGQTPCSSLVNPITTLYCQKSEKSFLSLPAWGCSENEGPSIDFPLLTRMAMTGMSTPRLPALLVALMC